MLRAALERGLDLPPLPESRREVESICTLSPGDCHRYLGSLASEENSKRLPEAATHLHFAVHGFLDDQFPLESFLALSVPEHWKEGEENGLLQAWEIIEQIRIDADLVTLSACNTGRGRTFAGEGLLGLSRAFQYAGARSVLASLWSVSDRSTAELMVRFYGHLEKGLHKAEALRSAQIDLLRSSDFSHPYHWAGFELLGDWR